MLNPGLRIYEVRCLKGWTQADLAARAGIAQANLSNIEKGKRDLTVSTLMRVASALEIKPSALIEEEAAASKPFKLTRAQIETLAEAVLNPKRKVPPQIRTLSGYFREISPEAGFRASTVKIQLAWGKLKQKLSSQEIRGICQRIEDARQRGHAKKAD